MYNHYYQDHEDQSVYYYDEINDQQLVDESCFEQYDNDMVNAVAEADYYDYRNDSLLELVVGVQTYLAEQAKFDSPLYGLQYKLYTYMRQRALDLGVQF
ncbi:hypothetical protein INT48_005296 [Thamnidium elegans]|uniref:Uncharacterized protein n=1 Tax=Thamnidium elegans TaxID=101142 RepID=A0A8H7SSS3_9FUNG|nr:hypothetical protein INT48_005296 [Thamnidium elegans]